MNRREHIDDIKEEVVRCQQLLENIFAPEVLERLKAKAQARRARASKRRTLKKREHRERRKKQSSSLEEDEIARRKEAFQAKKARRLARKEAATRALGAPSGAA